VGSVDQDGYAVSVARADEGCDGHDGARGAADVIEDREARARKVRDDGLQDFLGARYREGHGHFVEQHATPPSLVEHGLPDGSIDV
jgi:hypothetical protein